MHGILFGVVKWYDPAKRYGVIIADRSNITFGFSKNDGCRVHEGSDNKPAFDAWSSPTLKDPEMGDVLVFEDGGHGRRNGKPRVQYWNFEPEWTRVEVEIQQRILQEELEKLRLEEERLRCNPRFQVWEQVEVARKGLQGEPRLVASGDVAFLRQKFPLRVKYDPLITGPWVDIQRYVRTYKREVAGGWEDFSYDPRTLLLPQTFAKVEGLLADASFVRTVCTTSGNEEFKWVSEGLKIAVGEYRNGYYRVDVLESKRYAHTTFEGELAKRLYLAGKMALEQAFDTSAIPQDR